MSDTETHILALRMRVRDLELQAVEIKARYEEALSTLEMLEHPRRKPGRPRKVHDADAELPSIDDVRGILKVEETTP
jgi:hypothetical protein